MIETRNLSLRAGNFSLEGIDLTVKKGEYTALMGRTGCGKTRLLEALCGLQPITGGTVIIDGIDVTRASPASRGIGYVPQDGALFPTMNAEEHLRFPLLIRRQARAEVQERVEQLSRIIGIEHLLSRSTEGLSGGERQLVALGRALSFRPRLLILDEPLSQVDEASSEELCAKILEVKEAEGLTILHVTHSHTEARRVATRILRLDQGALSEE